jgi:hypothetical protein
VQLLEAANYMIRADFPDRWADLVPSITPYLEDSNPCHAVGALSILRLVYRKLQHFKEETMPIVAAVVTTTLPIVQRILSGALQHYNRIEALERAKLCLKIYHHAIRQPMPVAVRDGFRPWAQLCLQVISIVPDPADPSLPYIQSMQKRALICVVPLLNIYGRVLDSLEPADKYLHFFPEVISEKFAGNLLLCI